MYAHKRTLQAIGFTRTFGVFQSNRLERLRIIRFSNFCDYAFIVFHLSFWIQQNNIAPQSFKIKSHLCLHGRNFFLLRKFQNSSKLSKRPRFDLQEGAFSPVTMQVAGSNYPLQLFANGIFAIFRMTFEITSSPYYSQTFLQFVAEL